MVTSPPINAIVQKINDRKKNWKKSGVCYLIEIYLVKRKQERGRWKNTLFSDAGDIFTIHWKKPVSVCHF